MKKVFFSVIFCIVPILLCVNLFRFILHNDQYEFYGIEAFVNAIQTFPLSTVNSLNQIRDNIVALQNGFSFNILFDLFVNFCSLIVTPIYDGISLTAWILDFLWVR